DLRALLEFLKGNYALRDLETFARHVVHTLPKVIGSEITSYNEVDPRRRRITAWQIPPPPDELKPVFDQHIPEHPIVTHYQRTRDGQALKISDFLTQGQFHRLGLYNEFYRLLDVKHQMAIRLAAPPGLVIGVALNRSRRDFSERDRLLLNLLRPHLIQAYHNADAVTRMQREITLLTRGMEALERGIICLAPDGRVRLATSRARQWLAEYFGPARRRGGRLPEVLQRWVRHQGRLLASADMVPSPRQPWEMEREGKRLTIRLLAELESHMLLFQEEPTALQPAALEHLGLTRREAEVLAWVAEGKTNAEIGTILGARPRTVAKHLERIYQKLGVETRVAAANLALTSLREP
ncbi:MAG TPA: helix-turn-helix transcriptional regulator, partial [Candidatus Methylomirabilis sp.]